MAYAVIADMEGRLPVAVLEKLTADTQAGATYNAQINTALTRASARVDAYASVRYDTPLVSSDLIKGITLDIAVWHLQKERGTIREADQKAYDEAIKFLKDLAAVKAGLDVPAGEDPQTTSEESKVTTQDRVFSDTKMSGF